MFVDDCTYTRHGKTYRRVLLRNSYRVEGTVRHDTLANLSQCVDEEIEAIKFGLRHKGQLAKLAERNQTLCRRLFNRLTCLLQALRHPRDPAELIEGRQGLRRIQSTVGEEVVQLIVAPHGLSPSPENFS